MGIKPDAGNPAIESCQIRARAVILERPRVGGEAVTQPAYRTRDSQQLAQERFCWDYYRVVDAKAVGGLIGKIHDHLKGVRGVGLSLKISEPRRECLVAHFHFHQKPRFSIFDY